MAEGCKQSGAALIGGETAEHPGLMPEDEYDLAGFAVGVVDRKDMITGSELKDGDVLIGMASPVVYILTDSPWFVTYSGWMRIH